MSKIDVVGQSLIEIEDTNKSYRDRFLSTFVEQLSFTSKRVAVSNDAEEIKYLTKSLIAYVLDIKTQDLLYRLSKKLYQDYLTAYRKQYGQSLNEQVYREAIKEAATEVVAKISLWANDHYLLSPDSKVAVAGFHDSNGKVIVNAEAVQKQVDEDRKEAIKAKKPVKSNVVVERTTRENDVVIEPLPQQMWKSTNEYLQHTYDHGVEHFIILKRDPKTGKMVGTADVREGHIDPHGRKVIHE